MLDDLTLSPPPLPETDETDETDFSGVSNRDFLSAVFGTLPGDVRPVVVSFAGNPGTVSTNQLGLAEAGVKPCARLAAGSQLLLLSGDVPSLMRRGNIGGARCSLSRSLCHYAG
jgi:hypothetical protein